MLLPREGWASSIKALACGAAVAGLFGVDPVAGAGLADVERPSPEIRTCSVRREQNLAAVMRDGVTLFADAYRPTDEGSYPVLLMRLPYGKSAAQTYVLGSPAAMAAHCYIVVVQDVRGQFKSQGTQGNRVKSLRDTEVKC